MPLPIFNPRRVSKEEEDERVGGQDAWVTIDKTVGKVDEEKVKDYMDDIDTLLVFAGLYSAVLTAFLIESYKTLMADPTQALLQQLVSQSANYRFTAGFLNTTFDASQLPVFEVSTSAIRVNVCWFASLVISLSTASYGILVKQWLREYLAVDRTAVQERLRIRHFRTQGLKTWRLFDIAAILPMFLQLALTLFLVGICFFTAAVHESIGRTSLVLVCAWAFFLALAVLAPLVSARCPYKTTFLKTAFRRLRSYAHFLVTWFFVYARTLAAFLQLFWGYIRSRSAIVVILGRFFNPCAQFTSSALAQLSLKVHAFARRLRVVWSVSDESALAVVVPSNEQLTYEDWCETISDNQFHQEYMVPFAETTLEDRTSSWKEESTLRSDESADLIIFRDVDAIFLDDRILAMMREALQRRPPPGGDVLKFVVEVLEHRSDLVFRKLDARSAEPGPWPWALSHNARTTLVEMLIDSLLVHKSKTSLPDWYESTYSTPNTFWMNQTLSLVLALFAGNGDFPQITSSALEGWFGDRENSYYLSIVLSYQLKATSIGLPKSVSIKWQTHVLTLLLPVLKLLPAEDAAQAFTTIVYFSYGDLDKLIAGNSAQRTDQLPPAGHQDGEHAEAAQDNKVSPFVILTLLDVTAGILNSLTIAQADKPEGVEPERIAAFPESIQGLLDFMLQAIPFIQRTVPEADLRSDLPISRVDLETLIWTLLTAPTPRHTHAFLDFWSTRSTVLNTQLLPGQFLYGTVNPQYHIWRSFTDGQASKFLSTCAVYFNAKLSSDTPLELISAIQLCHLVYAVPTDDGEEVLRAWHTMFVGVIKCIDRLIAVHYEGRSRCTDGHHTDTCAAAFALLSELDLDQNDGKMSHRCTFEGEFIFEPTWSPKPERETVGYAAWRTSFEVETAQMPDDMVKTLLQFVCEAHTKDEEGRTFWRVRRLDDLVAHHSNVETTTNELGENTAAEDGPHPAILTDEAQPSYNVSAPIAPLTIASMPTEPVATSAVQAIPNSASSPPADSSSHIIHPSSAHALITDSEMHGAASRDPNNTLNLPAGSSTSQDALTAAIAQSATGMDIAESAVSTNSGCDDEMAAIAHAQSRGIQAKSQLLPSTAHDADIVSELVLPQGEVGSASGRN